MIVHTQFIRFLRYKQNRLVNVIIYKNLILQNLTYTPILVFTLLEIWVQNPGLYIGYIGCYGLLFTRFFMQFHDAAHSLFINLFRYLCIVKADYLSEHNIQPRVSLLYHSSEIRGLCLMKCSNKMLQNLPNFWNKKIQEVFFISYYFILFLRLIVYTVRTSLVRPLLVRILI